MRGGWNELATHRRDLCQRQSLPKALMEWVGSQNRDREESRTITKTLT